VTLSDVSMVMKALVFDVFGTVVDWRASLIADFTKWSETRGIKADWTGIGRWLAGRYSSHRWDEVRKHPERGYKILDELTAKSPGKTGRAVVDRGIDRRRSASSDHWAGAGSTRGRTAWPALTRLKKKYVIGPLSNGNVALLTNMAKVAGLPWEPRAVGGTIRAL